MAKAKEASSMIQLYNKWRKVKQICSSAKSNQRMVCNDQVDIEFVELQSPISYADCSKDVLNEQEHLLALTEKKEPNDHSIAAHPLRRHV